MPLALWLEGSWLRLASHARALLTGTFSSATLFLFIRALLTQLPSRARTHPSPFAFARTFLSNDYAHMYTFFSLLRCLVQAFRTACSRTLKPPFLRLQRTPLSPSASCSRRPCTWLRAHARLPAFGFTRAFTLRRPHSSSRLPSRACALSFLWLHARVLAAASLARASLAVASRAFAPPSLRLHTRASLLVTASLARAFLAVGSARMCASLPLASGHARLHASPSTL